MANDSWDSRYWRSETEREYRDLGYGMGCAMFGTPSARISTAKLALVGLNPGGDDGDVAWDWNGFAIADQKWGPSDSYNTFQRQVLALIAKLGLVHDDVFTAQFVPFRSPSWNELPRHREAVDFGRKLWKSLLPHVSARVFICLGRVVEWHIAQLLDAKSVHRLPTGWGNTSIYVHEAPDGRRVIGIPHPSRFQLFSRVDGLSDVADRSLQTAVGDLLKPAGPTRTS